MTQQSDPLQFFRLKPIRVARVSEISEATASAPIPAEKRVNFHIGNPLQDPRLTSAFTRIALGIDVQRTDLRDADVDALLEHIGWQAGDKPELEFLIRAIQKSNPYMPRGGYSRKSPHSLIEKFCSWLENQQEPLQYDTGKKSGKREIILASGGMHEVVRIILFALSAYLEHTPARILCYRFELQSAIKSLPHLEFIDLPAAEQEARDQIERIIGEKPGLPTFVLIGDMLEEETRHRLRLLSVENPLFFLEANNAPNHLSLGREAKLVERVIRLLSAGIFSQNFSRLAVVFVAGNADFLNVIENVHFNLKGTPSATEVEFLDFLLDRRAENSLPEQSESLAQIEHSHQEPILGFKSGVILPKIADRAEKTLDNFLGGTTRMLSNLAAKADTSAEKLSRVSKSKWQTQTTDELHDFSVRELIDLLMNNCQDPDWCASLQRSFIHTFTSHQPQYHPESCLVVSGSSRTALGIIGFHCGISEVVVSDLSWSYDQCFPEVYSVPLTADMQLDNIAIIEKVKELCRQDPSWAERGAVVIGNPHNATGRIFAEESVKDLIRSCLRNNIHIIDDLAYQNVAPVEGLPEIKTARQLADELAWSGEIQKEQADNLITVHSMSKTDCLAGARMSVVEIRDPVIARRFDAVNDRIAPNLAAIFICYLFYRNRELAVRTFWSLRNSLFHSRIETLLAAVENLPAERNPFELSILPPMGSMYPLLQIHKLPAGLSLDRLASSLARRGIGLLPLTTFARTEEGFEIARTTFRLTLGGTDGGEVLAGKTRRLLIDFNRLIAEQDAAYNRRTLNLRPQIRSDHSKAEEILRSWDSISRQIQQNCESICREQQSRLQKFSNIHGLKQEFLSQFLPERLSIFRAHLVDWEMINTELMEKARKSGGDWLIKRLETEFMKDSLEKRKQRFQSRSFDRTVHPTQMYSLKTEMDLDAIVKSLIHQQRIEPALVERASHNLWQEYLGRNVAISSEDEADEILVEQDTLIAGQEFADLYSNYQLTPFLSFWSDWDGSSRPSGQGHRLVAMLVMENVRRMSRLISLLRQADSSIHINPELSIELESLPQYNQRFTTLLNEITTLTQQLEQRYRGILPFSIEATSFQRFATRLHLRRDPALTLFQHNDRYERRMIELRSQRRGMLDHYFSINKKLRKQLFALIPAIYANRENHTLLYETLIYRDILQRTVITPRIHQGLITARDPFAINTTVYNLFEINALAGKYGNPGMMLAIQISLSTQPEALIALDRKMRHQGDQTHREYPEGEIPSIWSIPLFEEIEAVGNIRSYLDRVWDYAAQSRQTSQTHNERFTEIITELFVAGSDLSQQISQANAAHQYLKAKYDVQLWLSEHHLAEDVRLKLGSGEPMQRQGGYYSEAAGRPTFINAEESRIRFSEKLPPPARKSTHYAVTPLQGIFLARDLRTFQSNLAERLRSLPLADYVALLFHLQESQNVHRRDLIRAAETITESRLGAQQQSIGELERLTIGMRDEHYEKFLSELTDNFRHILYGQDEDVVGLHIISYFIARLIPQLRDRPTSRRAASEGPERGQQILVRIAEIIPLAKQGSLLRAISHNQAQTVVLGVNQLTTGLFRALERYAQNAFPEAESGRMTSELILPNLPVYDILHTLRIFQDSNSDYLRHIETAFPAGNSAFTAMREDFEALRRYLSLLQKELVRRQGLNVSDFFENGVFIQYLLPTLRPDLAVLLQKDLFNTDLDALLSGNSGRLSESWKAETARLLSLPEKIRGWRAVLWDALGESIFQRVQSFTELAAALYAFLPTRSPGSIAAIPRTAKPSASLAGYLRSAPANDEMRSFLLSAVEYLSAVTEGNLEVPVSIIRALNDVERIAQIEESTLPPETQDVIRFCVLQIARLAGENG